MNVLIVDDDLNYRYAISEIIPWKQQGFHIVGEAVNGSQALDMVRELSIDLIISDISMPLMNGIELIKAVKAEFPNIRIIVLSAYDDFAYVKQALQLGAEDYLLKYELNPTETLRVIQETKKKIMQDKKERRLQRLIRSQKQVLIDGVFRMIMTDDDTFSFEQLRDWLDIMEIPLAALRLIVIMIESETPITIERLDAHDAMNEYSYQAIFFEKNLAAVLLDMSHIVSEQELKQATRQFVLKLRQSLETNQGHASIGISDICYRADLLPDTFRKARHALQYKLYEGMNRDHYWEEYSWRQRSITIEHKEISRLYSKLVKANDLAGIADSLQQQEELLRQQMPTEQQLNNILIDWLLAIHAGAESLKRNEYELVQAFKNCQHAIEQARVLTEKIAVLRSYVEAQSIGLQDEKPSYSRDVQKTLIFIQQHFREKITLYDLAQHVQLSKNYICNLFKSEVGETIVHYINYLRVEEAKKLILHSNLKVYEISEQVGFQHPTYFSTVFKSLTNTTIMDFKKQGLGQVQE